jgi:DNA excision repair protein ERCC-3
MTHHPQNPLIVHGDHTVLVEVDSPRYEAARDGLARFAELIKSPEHVHTYRIRPLSIWNACAAGIATAEIVETLDEFPKYDVPQLVAVEIREYASRYSLHDTIRRLNRNRRAARLTPQFRRRK